MDKTIEELKEIYGEERVEELMADGAEAISEMINEYILQECLKIGEKS